MVGIFTQLPAGKQLKTFETTLKVCSHLKRLKRHHICSGKEKIGMFFVMRGSTTAGTATCLGKLSHPALCSYARLHMGETLMANASVNVQSIIFMSIREPNKYIMLCFRQTGKGRLTLSRCALTQTRRLREITQHPSVCWLKKKSAGCLWGSGTKKCVASWMRCTGGSFEFAESAVQKM